MVLTAIGMVGLMFLDAPDQDWSKRFCPFITVKAMYWFIGFILEKQLTSYFPLYVGKWERCIGYSDSYWKNNSQVTSRCMKVSKSDVLIHQIHTGKTTNKLLPVVCKWKTDSYWKNNSQVTYHCMWVRESDVLVHLLVHRIHIGKTTHMLLPVECG